MYGEAEWIRCDSDVDLCDLGHISRVLKHEVNVRCVVAVPGWEIDSQEGEKYLIVNEHNLAMLRGWKNENDYLMSEEVEKLQKVLTKRCTRGQ